MQQYKSWHFICGFQLGKVNIFITKRQDNLIYRQYLFKDRLPMLSHGLDAYALRQKTIAENIANASTEDYKPQAVRFEEFFKEAASSSMSTQGESNPNSEPDEAGETGLIQPPGQAGVPDARVYYTGEQQVNIDKEMSSLAQNQIRYRYAARAVKAYFSGIQSAISGLR